MNSRGTYSTSDKLKKFIKDETGFNHPSRHSLMKAVNERTSELVFDE